MDTSLSPDVWFNEYLSDSQRQWVSERAAGFFEHAKRSGVSKMVPMKLDQFILDELAQWKARGIKQSLSVMTWLVWQIDEAHEDPDGSALLVRAIDSMGVIQLYEECRMVARATREPGYEGEQTMAYEGGPRTLWEDRHGLDSAESRARFAWQETVNRGFRNG